MRKSRKNHSALLAQSLQRICKCISQLDPVNKFGFSILVAFIDSLDHPLKIVRENTTHHIFL